MVGQVTNISVPIILYSLIELFCFGGRAEETN